MSEQEDVYMASLQHRAVVAAEELQSLRADKERLMGALVPLLRHRPDGSIGWRGHKTAKCGWLLVEDMLRIEQALGREYADTIRAAIDAARDARKATP